MSEPSYLERVGLINAQKSAEREAATYLSPSSAESTGAWMDDVPPSDPDSQESRLRAAPPLKWLMEVTGVRPEGSTWYETETAAALSDSPEYEVDWKVPAEELNDPTPEQSEEAWLLPVVQQATMKLATQTATYQGFEPPSTMEQAKILVNAALAVDQGELAEEWLRSLPSTPFYVNAGNLPLTS